MSAHVPPSGGRADACVRLGRDTPAEYDETVRHDEPLPLTSSERMGVSHTGPLSAFPF